jgi:hypothetical protein
VSWGQPPKQRFFGAFYYLWFRRRICYLRDPHHRVNTACAGELDKCGSTRLVEPNCESLSELELLRKAMFTDHSSGVYGPDVATTLNRIKGFRGLPQTIKVDNVLNANAYPLSGNSDPCPCAPAHGRPNRRSTPSTSGLPRSSEGALPDQVDTRFSA